MLQPRRNGADAHTRCYRVRRGQPPPSPEAAGRGPVGSLLSIGRLSACTSLRRTAGPRLRLDRRHATETTPCRITHVRLGPTTGTQTPVASTPASTSSQVVSRISPTADVHRRWAISANSTSGFTSSTPRRTCGAWARTQRGRWYPTVTPLSNGEMLITRAASIRPRCGRRPACAQHRVAWLTVVSVAGRRPERPGLLLGPDQTLRVLDRPAPAHGRRRATRHDQPRLQQSRALRRRKVLVAGGGSGRAGR